MDADKRGFEQKELTGKVIGVFYDVYNDLGHGFIESVYERSLEVALSAAGVKVC
jgi:GxxExxY protein